MSEKSVQGIAVIALILAIGGVGWGIYEKFIVTEPENMYHDFQEGPFDTIGNVTASIDFNFNEPKNCIVTYHAQVFFADDVDSSEEWINILVIFEGEASGVPNMLQVPDAGSASLEYPFSTSFELIIPSGAETLQAKINGGTGDSVTDCLLTVQIV